MDPDSDTGALSEGPPEADAQRASAHALAAELRALVASVLDRQLSASEAHRLVDELEALRTGIEGPRRARYYELELTSSRAHSFVDYSPVSGRANPFGVPMTIERAVCPDGEPGVRARVRFGHVHEGPPHGVHGGIVAAVFDDLLGHAQHMHGAQALTATLTVRYRSVTPIDEDLELYARVERSKGRRWIGKAWCSAGETVTAEAEALFVGVDIGGMVRS
ncbi:MAG TPA: PaaI family thioesterase [Acidimicrobiales bacterium]|nr:PaaI family thioesterase [Acidimicrobiales bacterium]